LSSLIVEQLDRAAAAAATLEIEIKNGIYCCCCIIIIIMCVIVIGILSIVLNLLLFVANQNVLHSCVIAEGKHVFYLNIIIHYMSIIVCFRVFKFISISIRFLFFKMYVLSHHLVCCCFQEEPLDVPGKLGTLILDLNGKVLKVKVLFLVQML
jgi:hypothetical protein